MTLQNESNAVKMPLLHTAATYGDEDTVNTLIAQGADLRVLNQQEQTPLHSALFLPILHDTDLVHKKQAILKTFICHAPDLMAHKDNSGDTIFHLLALDDAWLPILQWLLPQHPEAAFYNNNHLHYPIHTAILNNALEIAKTLLLIEKVPLLMDAKGRTPLHYAARYGNKNMVKACVEHTTPFNLKDHEGKTPLMLAQETNNVEAMAILRQHRA